MVELETAIQELNTGIAHITGDCMTTGGEVVILLKELQRYRALDKEPEELEELVKKNTPRRPLKYKLADRSCPACDAYINWDALNDPVEYAPSHCKSCGQRFDWSGERQGKDF